MIVSLCQALSLCSQAKKVSPHPSHYLGAWNRLCDHLESLVSCSKCTIVIDLMNNLSGFELFCRSYDSLMDSSKMKSNKVFEVLGFFIGQLYCQDLMSVINYFYQAIPSASSPVWLSSKESLHEWMTEKVNNSEQINPLFMYHCLLVHPIELGVKYCYAPRNYKLYVSHSC